MNHNFIVESGIELDLAASPAKQTAKDVLWRLIERMPLGDRSEPLMVGMQTVLSGKLDVVPDLRGAFKTPVRKHRAYLGADDLPEFLQKLAGFDGERQTKLALLLMLLTFVRTIE
jgi:hypothetical protein